jgi:hypothetical protein
MDPAVESTSERPGPAGASFVHCANCGAPLTVHFCAACGAPRLDERPLTVRRFLVDLWNEVTSLDSITARTLVTLFRYPGKLTREYLDGHTRRYIAPLRLYLILFAVMIFVRAITHTDVRIAQEVRVQVTAQQAKGPLANIRLKRAQSHREVPDLTEPLVRATEIAFSNPWLHLIDPLFVAVVLALLFRKLHRNYAEHVVFALHLLAFNWALSVVTTTMHTAWSTSQTSVDWVSVVHWTIFGVYAYFAVQYVFPESRVWAGLKAFGVLVGSQVAMAVVPNLCYFFAAAWAVYNLK